VVVSAVPVARRMVVFLKEEVAGEGSNLEKRLKGSSCRWVTVQSIGA